MDNIKDILGTIIDFIVKHKRYFSAGLVFCFMMVLLFNFSVEREQRSLDPTSGVYKAYKVNENKKLEELITTYYSACATGDTATIESIATPLCDQEKSYLAFYSQYIDGYTVNEILTKNGLTDGSYIVSTVIDLKFVGIDTPAPGLDFFYVQKNEDGDFYINNLYGSFNQSNGVYDLDTDITTLIATFIQQDDVLAKEADVQQAYNEAVLSDENLNNFVTNTLQTAFAQWSVDYQAQIAAEEQAKIDAEQAAALEAEKAAAEAEEAANAYTGVIKSKANVREAADKNSTKIGQLETGAVITIYAQEGEFFKIDYEGQRAYVVEDCVQVDETGAAETTETTENDNNSNSIPEGTEITLTSTVNIRSQMDSSSSKVAVAYAGEKVKVVMSYAEGWTKVKYGKKEGYIKTDLLKN